MSVTIRYDCGKGREDKRDAYADFLEGLIRAGLVTEVETPRGVELTLGSRDPFTKPTD